MPLASFLGGLCELKKSKRGRDQSEFMERKLREEMDRLRNIPWKEDQASPQKPKIVTVEDARGSGAS